MADLTDTQLVLLSAAAQRDDHVIPIADRLKGAIATTVAEKMIALGLAEERLVDLRTPAWRWDEDGHSIALLISVNGLAPSALETTGRRSARRLQARAPCNVVRVMPNPAMRQHQPPAKRSMARRSGPL